MAVTLSWALVRGEVAHISNLARYRGREHRPTPLCLECGAELVMRLGDDREHHFAHKTAPDHGPTARRRACEGARPGSDSDLRTNVLCHLYTILRGCTDGIHIERQCGRAEAGLGLFDRPNGSAAPPCARRSDLHLRGWTSVQRAQPLAETTLDITVHRRDVIALAVMVRAERALPPETCASLDAAGVPWLEVLATHAHYPDIAAWEPARPFPYTKLGRALLWHCIDHGGSPPSLFEGLIG